MASENIVKKVNRTGTSLKSGILTALSDWLLLTCALVGVYFSFISLYSAPDLLMEPEGPTVLEHIANMPFLRLISIPLLLSLLSAVVWSLPKYRLPSAGALAALWLFLVYRLRKSIWYGGHLVVKVVADLLKKRMGFYGTILLDVRMSPAEEIAAVEHFLLAALILLALLLGWCVIRARRWWLVALITAAPLAPGLLMGFYPNWIFFIMLVACWCTMLIASLCARSDGRGMLTVITLPTTVLLLFALIHAIPQETYTQPEWAIAAQTKAIDLALRYTPSFLWRTKGLVNISVDGGEGGDGDEADALITDGEMGTLDLSAIGPLEYTGQTMLQISGTYSGRVYLRGAAQTWYSDNTWQSPGDLGAVFEENFAGLSDSDSPLLYLAEAAGGAEPDTITVQNVSAHSSSIYLPYQLAVQDISGIGLTTLADVALMPTEDVINYTAKFLPGALDLENIAPNYAVPYDPIRSEYEAYVFSTYGPDAFPDELLPVIGGLLGPVDDIAEIQGQHEKYSNLDETSQTFLKSADHVAELLGELCEYDKDTPQLPEGEDFVEYFLIEGQRGYCMHFASAATLMLRYLGVPARYVSGFVVSADEDEIVDVIDEHSHAWVEIYLPGYGWYPVETTPGYTSLGDANSSSDTAWAEDDWYEDELLEEDGALDGGETGAGDEDQSALRTMLKKVRWPAVVVTAIVLLWFGQYLLKRHRAKRLGSPNTNRAALDGYRYLVQLTRWGGYVDPKAVELAQKARFSQHTLTEDERQVMAGFFHDERSGISEELPFAKKLLFRYVWGIPESREQKSAE